MPYNLDIAGQMSEEELSCIERMAASVPQGGRVVELGSLFGRSSWAWAKSVDPTVTVYCVDPWRRENWIARLEQQFGITFGVETFHRNTADCINIVALPGYSPDDLGDWNLPVDLYFDDSVHANPTFRENLEFWMRHVRPGGIMSGHDYRPEFPDVVTEVRALAERFGTTARIVGSIWSVQLPDGDRQGMTSRDEPSALDLLQSAGNEDTPQLPHNIGSMMQPAELHLLYALAKHHYSGVGEVIDLGPFLGSSTFMLVEGLLANTVSRRRQPRVFSFDRFIYEPHKGYDAFLRAEDLPTSSFFPHFAANLGHRIQNVYCSPGDLLQLR